jgi:hypothetical protein
MTRRTALDNRAHSRLIFSHAGGRPTAHQLTAQIGPFGALPRSPPRRLAGGLAGSWSGLFCLLVGELGPDLVCFGRAELGVQGECPLPVAAGLLAFADNGDARRAACQRLQ